MMNNCSTLCHPDEPCSLTEDGKCQEASSGNSDLLFAGTSPSNSKENDALTIDMLNEAVDLIKALAPPEAPPGEFAVLGQTGLRIIKNDHIPENTVMVSKRLFDLIYESSK